VGVAFGDLQTWRSKLAKNFSFLLLISFVITAAQIPSGLAEEKYPDGVLVEDVSVVMNVEHIELSFLVRDPEGNMINDLSADDFTLLENGEEKRIVALKEQEVPIHAAVMVDTSWSLGSFFDDALMTGLEFFRGLDREGSCFLLFSEKPRVLLDWDDNDPEFALQLENVRTDGTTALYDSVIKAVNHSFENRSGKKLIVLITDGIDTRSRHTFEDMIKTARREGVALYSILYTNQTISDYRDRIRRTGFRRDKRVSSYFHDCVVKQNQFLEESLRFGGRTIFSNGFSDLKKRYAQIVKEMKSHYVLLYESEAENQDDVREVKIASRVTPAKVYVEVSR